MMMRTILRRLAILLVLLAPALGLADAVVLKSSDPAYTPGQTIAAGAQASVAAGASVTVMLQSGDIVELAGEGGTISAGGGDAGVVQVVAELLKGRRSGVAVLGAIRGAEDKTEQGPALNPLLDAVFCYSRGTSLHITLPPRSYERSIELVGETRGKATYPPSNSSISWPIAAKLSDGASYRVILEGVEIGEVTLHQLDFTGGKIGERVVALARRGCNRQAIFLLENAS